MARRRRRSEGRQCEAEARGGGRNVGQARIGIGDDGGARVCGLIAEGRGRRVVRPDKPGRSRRAMRPAPDVAERVVPRHCRGLAGCEVNGNCIGFECVKPVGGFDDDLFRDLAGSGDGDHARPPCLPEHHHGEATSMRPAVPKMRTTLACASATPVAICAIKPFGKLKVAAAHSSMPVFQRSRRPAPRAGRRTVCRRRAGDQAGHRHRVAADVENAAAADAGSYWRPAGSNDL